MSRFDSLDYAALPLPDAVQSWAFSAILDARMADFVARWELARLRDPSLPAYDVGPLESDPAKILQEVDAYREGLVRQRINEAVRATYLATACGNDLVARAAEYMTAAQPGETEASLRMRAQLAWENLSIGGSYGGYAYQARSVAPHDIADVAVWGFEISQPSLFGGKAILDFPKGEVRIALLGSTPSGLVASSLVDRVQAVLADRTRRKVNDRIRVVGASLVPYGVEATLVLKRGALAAPVIAAAQARALAYAGATRLIGVAATRGGFQAALMAAEPGLVSDVELRAPAGTIGGGPCEAPVLTGVVLTARFA